MLSGFVLLLVPLLFWQCRALEQDPNGYLTYCPCMGRFGNQADHFLGALAFARALNRTLLLPPWVEYRRGALRSNQVPFDTYFQVEPLLNYHRVVLLGDFMREMAPSLWPPSKRTAFCYMERKRLPQDLPETENESKKDCHAKYGNPFGPFWDTHGVDFAASEFYGPLLHFDVVHHSDMAAKWRARYTAADWPVLAFTGAPASFPVLAENRELQRHLQWTPKYRTAALEFIREQLPRGAFIGLHLRNGIDWVRACEHVRDSRQLFASPQCLGGGYQNERGGGVGSGGLYAELCFPPKELIVRQIKRLVKRVRQSQPLNEIRSIFVASDSNHMISELNVALARMNISAHKLPADDPHLDLAILGLSNHFIGNCVSSYTAFVKRERDVSGFPSYFWAYPNEKERTAHAKVHEEL